MRGERWATSRVVAATAAAWFFLGAMIGCGDAPNPCDSCPRGTRCQRVPLKKGDPINAARWECLRVEKEILGLMSAEPLGSGEGPLSDTVAGGGGSVGTE